MIHGKGPIYTVKITLMILKSTEDNLECVKCSDCPVVSEGQIQCPENANLKNCSCSSITCSDTICNGTEILTASPSTTSEPGGTCQGATLECQCNDGFCRESGDYETKPSTRCIPCDITIGTCSPPSE